MTDFDIQHARDVASITTNSLVFQTLHAACDEIERLRKEREWQPIETAPKNGTPILARAKECSVPFVVFWSSHVEEFGPMPALPENSVIERVWMLANSEDSDLVYDPTHWSPL